MLPQRLKPHELARRGRCGSPEKRVRAPRAEADDEDGTSPTGTYDGVRAAHAAERCTRGRVNAIHAIVGVGLEPIGLKVEEELARP